MLGVKVSREIATRFGCVVIDPETSQARHYVEKPDEFISDTINGGIYLFDKSIFDEIKDAMDVRQDKLSRDPLASQDEQLRLEQDVIAPLAASKKLFVYLAQTPWSQLKRAGSALPSNALILDMYKTTNPMLLRRRSPTIIAKSRADYSRKKGPDIVEPCFIDETAEVDPSAKLGPNVSVGPGVKIGYGCRVKDAIILDNTVMEQSSVAIHAIVGEDCKLGAWARVEGSPFRDEAEDSQDVCIIGASFSLAELLELTRLIERSQGRHRLARGQREELHRLAPQDPQPRLKEQGPPLASSLPLFAWTIAPFCPLTSVKRH